MIKLRVRIPKPLRWIKLNPFETKFTSTEGVIITVDSIKLDTVLSFTKNWHANHKRVCGTGWCEALKKRTTLSLGRVVVGHTSRGYSVDHIDRDVTNNKITNLRVLSHRENCYNRGKTKSNASGFIGISKADNKWMARIRVGHRELCLGRYETKEEAARVYDKAAKLHRGSLAVLNFPEVLNDNI